MTSLDTAAAPPVTSRLGLAGAAVRAHAPSVAVTATLAWWATYLVWGTGGREPHLLSVGIALLLAGALLVRPWRTLPLPALVLGNGVGLAALVVVLTAPTGFAGLPEAASYAYAGQLGLVVLAWATTTHRRFLVLGTILVAGALEFSEGWLAWWGLQDQTKLFQGTFYWHNQAGIFLAAGALLAFALVASAQRPLHLLGWVVGPLCTAGVVYTTSRGSQLGLALGVLVLLALSFRVRGNRAAPPRLLGVAGLAWGVTNVLTGPPFFSERVSATAATAARSESFFSNGVQRFEDWRRAVAIFGEWPLTGAGFYSYDSATMAVTTKRDGVSTAFAHNGFLQALSDGGLVLALPLFLAVAAVLLVGTRAVPSALRAGELVQPGALVTFVVLMLHCGMDFDWTYPSLLSLAALTGVLALPPTGDVAGDVRPRSRRVATVCVALTVLLLAASAAGAWGGGLDLNAPLPRSV
ncbi:MAG: O-antigen ligase family protein [Nocardioides sp.]